MPSRWDVMLPGVNAANVKLEYLHAVVSRWFDDGDDAHRASAKPYTVCPARAVPGGVTIELGLLDDSLPDRLGTVAAAGTRVRLGSTWSTITRPPRQLDALPWTDLTASTDTASSDTPSADTAWCLRFLTPTTFRRGNAFSPAPSLSAILGSLRSCWQRFAPATVPPLVLDLAREPVWVTDIEVTSHVVPVNGLTVSGFTGRLRFACDGTAEQAAAIDRLVRLAPYAGVGAYTTRGFGVTRPEPTWPSTAPRRLAESVHHRPPELVSG